MTLSCVQAGLAQETERLLKEEDREAWERILGPYLRVGVLCGGTGVNREASLQGARTVVQQLDTLHLLETGRASALSVGLPCNGSKQIFAI